MEPADVITRDEIAIQGSEKVRNPIICGAAFWDERGRGGRSARLRNSHNAWTTNDYWRGDFLREGS